MNSVPWQQRIGNQRDWVWRGWRIRYTYFRSAQNGATATSNPPIIFLHGFGASIGHWRENLSVFSRSHPVYALDLLGFGASEKAIAPYNAELWAELVYDFWQTFIGHPAILVGNSIGSLIGLVAAATYPQLARGLVMISLPDPSVQLEAIPAWMLPLVEVIQSLVASPLLLRPVFYWVRRPSVLRQWAKLAYQNPEAVTEELLEIFIRPTGDRGAARAFCALFKAMGNPRLGPGVKTLLPQLKIPILLIWGNQDRLIPLKFVQPKKYLQYSSNLKLIELDQAGHCPHDECPEQVNQEILNWLASLAVKPRSEELEANC
ncbi:MAG: alpha/beta fold hydrolase [Microcoleaceae cyanobacterium]